MKQLILPVFAIFICMILFVTVRCKKDHVNTSVPVLTTDVVLNISPVSCTSGGNITDDGGSEVTERGICWNEGSVPFIDENEHTHDGSGMGVFFSSVNGLDPNTSYYVRAYATNKTGTGYGIYRLFQTLDSDAEIVTDYDGNTYNTVTIGTQVWMAENLRTTHFRNSDPIAVITNANQWSDQASAAYCNYDNDENNTAIYGRLYDWYAVKRNDLCPPDYHMPDTSDFETLIDYLGGEDVAGKKLKEAGLMFWYSPNSGNNESGFTGRPGGYRRYDGIFNDKGRYGYWWSATELLPVDTNNCYCYWLLNNSDNTGKITSDKKTGYSVRCIKDVP